jgi:uncharacterized protein (DUF1684 family)
MVCARANAKKYIESDRLLYPQITGNIIMIETRAHKEYHKEIQEWHSNRLMELKKPESWLSVIGLFWLEPGENTYGSHPSNTIIFPKLPGIPDRIGSLLLENNTVHMNVNPEANVTIQGKPVTSSVIFGKSKRPVTASLGSLHWQVIKRQDLIGLRLRNTKNPAIEAFTGIERFPISLDWRIPAQFDRYNPPRKIEVPNVLGQINRQLSPGAVVFKVGTREFRLDVTGTPENKSFFIVFGDMTNGYETYKRGRFLSVVAPNEDGELYVDFNKAYNPPCAFTDYATCPIPPSQNQLSIRIEAGEKKV